MAFLTAIGTLSLTYTNCSRKPYSLYDNMGSLFQAPQEFSYSGNGGGYNGPHLSFELIPPIDDTESAGLEVFATNVESAWRTCQLGDQARGVVGVFPKIAMQFNGIATTKFCGQLDSQETTAMFGAFADPRLMTEIQANPMFELTYDFFKSLSDVATQIKDEAKRQIAFKCFKGYLEISRTFPGGDSKQMSLKSIGLSDFDSQEDPNSEQNTAIGNTYNLKIRLDYVSDDLGKGSVDGSAAAPAPLPALRLRTENGFPIFSRNDQFYNPSGQLFSDPEKYKAKFIPVLPLDLGIKTPLFDTVTNKRTEFTVNQFDYLSCIQGELYRELKGSGTFEQATTKTVTPRSTTKVCDILKPWKMAIAGRLSLNSWSPVGNNLKSVSQSWEQEYDTRIGIAKELFAKYLRGEIELSQIDDCLADTDETQDFLNSLRTVFYQESVRTIGKSSNPNAVKFLSALRLFDSGGAWTLFDLRGINRLTPSESAAGEHRRHQNIFMDFSKIHPESWWIIFMHEILHRLDADLVKSSYYFSLAENKSLMSKLAADHQGLDQLSPSERESLDNWIRWGFDRGLHSEYKAWLATFQLYQVLRGEGVIPSVSWVDHYLKERNTQEPLFRCELFNDLNKNAKGIYTFGLLNSALMKEAISEFVQKNHQCKDIQTIKTVLEQ